MALLFKNTFKIFFEKKKKIFNIKNITLNSIKLLIFTKIALKLSKIAF